MSDKCEVESVVESESTAKSVSLESILSAFHCAVKQEQCWALIYQTIHSLCTTVKQNKTVNELSKTSRLLITIDGYIDGKSWRSGSDSDDGHNTSLKRVLNSIGRVMYEALDYGNSPDEETVISNSLAQVITLMADIDDSGSDEGIEDDCVAHTCDAILDCCAKHVEDCYDVGLHYRNVCRALVAEAMQLSTFLRQIAIGTKDMQTTNEINCDINGIQIEIWAHLWMKVMHELRVGVTLKSFDGQSSRELRDRQKREYELTPFEMLLNDINHKRYTLKKVTLPMRVQKDAQSMILDFIRSRPPLKPVTDRVLRPPVPHEPCLHQKLMESIKRDHELKPTTTLQRRLSMYFQRPKRRPSNAPNICITEYKGCVGENIVNENVAENTVSVNPFYRFSFRNLSLRKFARNSSTFSLFNPTIAATEAINLNKKLTLKQKIDQFLHKFW